MNCLDSTIKYIIFLFNLAVLICGVLLIVFGSLIISNLGEFSKYHHDTEPILIIVLGCIVLVISFFGCCGAIQENSCYVSVYATFMLIILVLQTTLIIWAFVYREDIKLAMKNVVQDSWNENDEKNGYPMNSLQKSFQCCGVNSYVDYTGKGLKVPNSCCGTEECHSDAVYKARPGCKQALVDFWASNTNIIRYAGLGVALVELVALVSACCLASSIRKSHRIGF